MAARHQLSRLARECAALLRWPVYSRTSFALVERLRRQGLRPRVVFDVGANRGQFTVAARNLLRPDRIDAFEPLPEAAAALRRHCTRYPEVTVHELALGSRSGRETLHVNVHSQASSLLELGERHRRAFPRARPVGEVEVRVQRLDALVTLGELARPVLAKVDTQGYEAEVLAGATGLAEAIDWLVLETSFDPLYAREEPFVTLLEVMGDMGFRFDRPVGALMDPATGEYLQMDALFSRV
jgi:FkbM family methyltransferase